jgi:hypothetical protein
MYELFSNILNTAPQHKLINIFFIYAPLDKHLNKPTKHIIDVNIGLQS